MFFLPPFAHKEEDFVHGLDLIHEELDKAGMEFRLKSASRWVMEQIERLCPGNMISLKTGTMKNMCTAQPI